MISFLDRLIARIRAVFTRRRLDADLEEELAHHLELQTADFINAGLSPDEALRRARIALGGAEQTRELHRETRSLQWLEVFFRDVSYAVRTMRREPGFAVVVVLIIAVGIGLNTAVFSLVNTILLRAIPFTNSDRLVWIYNGEPTESSHSLSGVTSQIDTWEGLRETSRSLEQVEAYNPFSLLQTYRLDGLGGPETITSIDVSAGLFPMLGVRPQRGRLFEPNDAVVGAPRRVLLSQQLWQRRYGGDPHVIGQLVQINGTSAEVIGVLSKADSFTSVFFPAVRVDLYAPLSNEDFRPSGNAVALIGRAKAGLTIEDIRSDLKVALAQAKKNRPSVYEYCSANVVSLQNWVTGNFKQPIRFVWMASGLVLMIITINLGGLLLARGAARGKEFALRYTLGAGHRRISSQLLTECFVIVAAGSLIGGFVAWVFLHILTAAGSVEIPLLQNVHLDGACFGFTVLLCILTVGLCGAFPAWKVARVSSLAAPLQENSRGLSTVWGAVRTQSIMVIFQVALACVLTISAGLIVRSFVNILNTDLGFNPSNLIAVRIDLVGDGSPVGYLDQLLERVRAIPGVEHAALTDCIPVERDRGWAIATADLKSPRWSGAHVRLVTTDLFSAMGTVLLCGRDFSREDADANQASINYNQNVARKNPAAIVINQTLANRLYPGDSALGHTVDVMGNFRCKVIAVASDVRHDGPELPSDGEMYLSISQVEGGSSWDLMVRTNLPVGTLRTELRNSLREFDANLPLTKIRPMQDLVDRTLSSRRLLVWLISGFALVAVGLCAFGLYGVVSYMVTQKTKEIGIRMALGAEAKAVRCEVVGKTMKLASCGILLGLILAASAGNYLRWLLQGVTATDYITYVLTVLTILLCTLLAGYIPARRASRVDPIISLRVD